MSVDGRFTPQQNQPPSLCRPQVPPPIVLLNGVNFSSPAEPRTQNIHMDLAASPLPDFHIRNFLSPFSSCFPPRGSLERLGIVCGTRGLGRLVQWSSTWSTHTPSGKRIHLMTFVKLKKYIILFRN
jgi:hypothetical protein